MDRKIPPLLGLALTILRRAHGWSAMALAAAAGVAPSTISQYETGDLTLTRERLEELARAMGLEPPDVERAVAAASLVHPGAPAPGSPVDPTEEERRIIDKAKALAGRDAAALVGEDLVREVRAEHTREQLAAGRERAERLKTYSAADRQVLVEGAPDYQVWGVAVALCEDSEKQAARDPAKALELAELALLVARQVPEDAFRPRLMGWCTGFVANAERVGSALRRAEASFARAWGLWREGEDEAGLLSEAYLLDLEASLRRDQRHFPRALELHEEALEAARPGEVGTFLLNQSATLEEKGDYEASIAVLDQAARHVDGEREPRQLWVLRFNQGAALGRLGRAAEAARLLPEVRALAERLRNDIDLIRTLWLDAIVDVGLGRRAEARAKLEQVRRAFDERKVPYDYALASLDLALLCREEGRCAEIVVLAGEMLELFKAQGVHREAMAAVALFCEAAEKEQVTAELIRRLKDYLARAKGNPRLRFEA